MKLHEIENLTAAELKARRDELAKAIVEGIYTPPPGLAEKQLADELAKALVDGKHTAVQLAARYVQARTDAKLRDELLAEQGATIKALQDGSGALMQQVAGLQERLEAAMTWADAGEKAAAKANEALQRATALAAEREKGLKSVHEAQLVEADALLKSEADANLATINGLRGMLAAETARADAALALAKARRQALAQLQTIIGPLLAAE